MLHVSSYGTVSIKKNTLEILHNNTYLSTFILRKPSLKLVLMKLNIKEFKKLSTLELCRFRDLKKLRYENVFLYF